ncbi:FecCD family ABC transporter permease [Jeotgalibacillus proteolyticus]|uniref:Iron ABC transporter permease n=1 Tax=Jeotgalibacillus proteolyticus TaxID=2082395 RepID=A0A2S5G9A1_9BACL|nr:iron ABC transporter permease [Jeotgalibacillus proteolyticus]PPA69582.1 iron ABC transporter permease [Jeotgalibacillus proteolyticus]
MIHPSLLKKQRLLIAAFILLVLATMVISLGFGYSSVSYSRIIPTLLGQGEFKDEFVLFELRLPRMIVTLLAGMALAVSGSVLQSITRNDLADPGIIGINSGAGAAVAVFFLFLPIEAGTFTYIIPAVAFAGALVTSILIYLFAYEKSTGLQPIRLILIGVGFSFALSGLMIVLISSAEREKVDFIAQWLAGNVWGTSWPFVLALLPWLLILVPFVLYKGQRLNILNLSESAAIGVGIVVNRERLILMLAAVALAASAVSVTGGIAFVGLMAPHIAKSLIGPRNQLFIPLAMLIGGWLLLTADTIGRNIIEPDGIPAGVIVAIIGAPYFVWLLLKK